MPCFLSPCSAPPSSPPRSSSSSTAYLQLESLPDLCLKTIAEHLKPVDSIKGLQVGNRWALNYFANETKKVVLWSKPLLEETEEKEKKELTYGQMVVQRATALWFLLSDALSIKPTIDPKMEEKQRKRRLRRHATVLGSFLSRFPNLTILQADKKDKELGPVLVEVFKHKAFPTVERFEDAHPFGTGVFYGHVPFTHVAAALPNLRMVGLDSKKSFLGVGDLSQIGLFFTEFGNGMFPKVQEVQLHFLHSNDETQEACILDFLVQALESRERVGRFPSLTELFIQAIKIDLSSMEKLLSLDSCSKLQCLQSLILHTDSSLQMQEAVAAYMRWTQCRWLEYVSIGRLHTDFDGYDDPLGPIGDVIRSGMAINLKTIEGNFMEQAGFEELSHMIEAGLLPNLEELYFSTKPINAVNIAAWTNGVLNPLIIALEFWPDPTPPLTFLLSLHQGAFPNLKHVCFYSFKEVALRILISMLQSKGVQGAHTLRYLSVHWGISDETLQQLRALLPAAKVRRFRQ